MEGDGKREGSPATAMADEKAGLGKRKRKRKAETRTGTKTRNTARRVEAQKLAEDEGEGEAVCGVDREVELELGFDGLPDEMLLAVVEWLPLGARLLCRAVSRRWRAVLPPVPEDGEMKERLEVRKECIRQWPLDSLCELEALWSNQRAKVCDLAASVGRLDVLQAAHHKGYPWNEGTRRRAAEGGHLEVLQWSRANGCPWDEATCMYAAEGGHLEVLKWARANGCPWDGSSEMK